MMSGEHLAAFDWAKDVAIGTRKTTSIFGNRRTMLAFAVAASTTLLVLTLSSNGRFSRLVGDDDYLLSKQLGWGTSLKGEPESQLFHGRKLGASDGQTFNLNFSIISDDLSDSVLGGEQVGPRRNLRPVRRQLPGEEKDKDHSQRNSQASNKGPNSKQRSKYATRGRSYTSKNARYSSYRRYANDDDYYSETYDVPYATLHPSRVTDVWLCLACALGWAVWLISMQDDEEKNKYQPYETADAKRVQGHVLSVSIGQDPNGTDMPIYKAVVDYQITPSPSFPVRDLTQDSCDNLNASSRSMSVVCGDGNDLEDDSIFTGRNAIQIRKCFQTRRLLEEGFLNVELLVLNSDPTMSILLDDYLTQVKQRQSRKAPSSATWWLQTFIPTLTALVLIVTSFVGAFHSILRLPEEWQVYGWISVVLGGMLLVPMALFAHDVTVRCYRLAGPLTERPGEIIHVAAKRAGSRFRNRRASQRTGTSQLPTVYDDDVLGQNNVTPKANNRCDLWSSAGLEHPGGSYTDVDRYVDHDTSADSDGHYNIVLPSEGHASSVSSLSSVKSKTAENGMNFFSFFQSVSKSLDGEDELDELDKESDQGFRFGSGRPSALNEDDDRRFPQIELAATHSRDNTDVIIENSDVGHLGTLSMR